MTTILVLKSWDNVENLVSIIGILLSLKREIREKPGRRIYEKISRSLGTTSCRRNCLVRPGSHERMADSISKRAHRCDSFHW
ncbi:hypothetical protein TRIP_E90087 [uncultured Spirochaetota bacterium]|uniref:Uncharacterized protein n=1 Tax=uncultured Spirochaetota bacterium TaxID=460511 RepID=A0A653A0T6_9SPIR|nr:hypothetical protein TRIP_E90087 [uncultured Spirochaetota bacterium]